MEGISGPKKDPKEIYDHKKIISFIRDSNSEEFNYLRKTIINKDVRIGTNSFICISSRDIWDSIVEIRHKLWKIKEGKRERDEAFDKAYQEVFSGNVKFVAGLKKLTGYLLHIFDEDKEDKKQNLTLDVNKALKDTLGPNRNRIFYAFFDEVKCRKPEEDGINMLETQVKAFKKIKEKYKIFGSIEDKDSLFDYFVRKYNLEQENNKEKSQ